MSKRVPLAFAIVGLASLASLETGCALLSWRSVQATVRVDYFHDVAPATGHDRIAIERATREGPWTGADPVEGRGVGDDLGEYRVEVIDSRDGRVVYADGFCSIFGEWSTTKDAREHPATRFE